MNKIIYLAIISLIIIIPSINAECTDTDGGINVGVKGTCVNHYGTQSIDFCVSTTNLAEYRCDGNYCSRRDYDLNNRYCVDGALIICETHDYLSCLEDKLYWYDSCNNKEELEETCTYGCNEGACLAMPLPSPPPSISFAVILRTIRAWLASL